MTRNTPGPGHQCLVSWNTFLAILASGSIAEIVLEIFAWWIVPAVLGRPMRPDILVADFARVVFDADFSVVLAASIHTMLAVFVFPLLFVLARSLFNFSSTLMPAAIYGLILWAVAQSILAPLAGRPIMLGFIAYTRASLIGHILYAIVLAHVFDRLSK